MGTWLRSGRAASWALVVAVASACGARSELEITDAEPPPGAAPADASTEQPPDAKHPVTDAGPAEAGPCRHDAGGGGGPAWLYDECLWEEVPPLAPCKVYQARLPDEAYPEPAWSNCGAGCRVIEPNILLPYVEHTTGYFAAERPWSTENQSYTSVQIGGIGVPTVNQFVTLEPFHVIAAFQTRNSQDSQGYADCENFDVIDGFGPRVMLAWEHDLGDGPGDGFHSLYYFAGSRYRETSTLDPVIGSYDRGPGYGKPVGGLAFTETHWSYQIGGDLYFTDDWTTPPPHSNKIHAPHAWIRRTFGAHLYWLEGADLHNTTVSEWTPSGGVHQILKRPDDVWIIDAVWGGSGLVWLEGKNTGSLFSDLSVWQVTDPSGAQPGPATMIATLPGEYSPGIVADGGYLATVTCVQATFDYQMTPDKCPLFVLRLSDAKLWTLGPHAKDRWWAEPRLVDEKHLLIGDLDFPKWWGSGSQKLYLLDVSELDALEQLFPSSGSSG